MGELSRERPTVRVGGIGRVFICSEACLAWLLEALPEVRDLLGDAEHTTDLIELLRVADQEAEVVLVLREALGLPGVS